MTPSDPAYASIQELMDAVDEAIPTPERAVDQPFLMPIEDVFGIKGRGTVVTGRIERGQVQVGETIEILGMGQAVQSRVVTGVEMFRKILDAGEAGDNVGCLLRGVERDDVQRGQVLAAPGSIAAQGRFRANVYVLSREEGGRHTPFFPGYRPQFYIRTTDVTGAIELPAGTEMVMPGDNVEMGVELAGTGGDRAGGAVCDPRGRPHGRRRGCHHAGVGWVPTTAAARRESAWPEEETALLSRSRAISARERNYTTTKNRRNDSGRLALSKYCRRCRAHQLHRETR